MQQMQYVDSDLGSNTASPRKLREQEVHLSLHHTIVTTRREK
jgi:hypothetical protein